MFLGIPIMMWLAAAGLALGFSYVAWAFFYIDEGRPVLPADPAESRPVDFGT